MRTEPQKSNIGLTKLELIVALLILAGILVFMTLQFSSPPSGTEVEEAYAEVVGLFHENEHRISTEGWETISSYTLEKPNLYGLTMQISYHDDPADLHLRYTVPTEATCNALLEELSLARAHSPDSSVLPLAHVIDLECKVDQPGPPHLRIDFSFEGN